MTTVKWGVLLLLFLLDIPQVYSQEQGTKMKLEDIFQLADENSKSQKAYSLKIGEAQKDVRSAKNGRLPDVDASLSFSYLGNGYIWDRDFSNGMKADMPHFGNNFALTASQVIYSGGAVSSGIEMAEIGEKMAMEEKLQDRNNMRFLIAGYYLEMYKLTNQIRVYGENIQLTNDLIETVRAQYEQGTALENDITRYELQLENYRLDKARLENNRHIMNYRLNKLVGLDENTVIEVDSASFSSVPSLDSSDIWQQTAMESAHDLSLAELNIQQSLQKKKQVRSEALPKISLIAEEHLDGPITIEVPALNNNFNYWFLGVGVRYNLASLYTNKSKRNRASMEVKRHEEELDLLKDDLSSRIEDDYVRYGEAVFEVETLKKSVTLANQNYHTIHTRYLNGISLATDMLEVSNAKLDAELRLANARANVVYSFYKLKHTSGTL